MADTLVRIGPTSLTGSAATVYTVPGATVTLLRDIHFCNETGSDATVTVSIGSDGSGKRILKDYVVPANDYRGFVGGIKLGAAEVVQAYGGTSGAVTLTATVVESA